MQALENTTRKLREEKSTLIEYVQEKDQSNDVKVAELDKVIAT